MKFESQKTVKKNTTIKKSQINEALLFIAKHKLFRHNHRVYNVDYTITSYNIVWKWHEMHRQFSLVTVYYP
jgi:hypothetical protein